VLALLAYQRAGRRPAAAEASASSDTVSAGKG
jgi:hypothetical protein